MLINDSDSGKRSRDINWHFKGEIKDDVIRLQKERFIWASLV